MTLAQPPAHCGHECRCKEYREWWNRNTDRIFLPCPTLCDEPCDDTRRQHPQPNTPRFVSNSVLVRCDKEDCIDFNNDLCQPWKCNYWKSKQPDALVQYESWISGMKYTDIKAAGTVAAIWIGNQRFLLDDEAERKRIIRQQQGA